MENKPAQNIQDTFLNTVRKDKTPITIYLVSGVKLTGKIRSFDKYSVLLENNSQEQLIFKHAISTVVSTRSVLHGEHRPPHTGEVGLWPSRRRRRCRRLPAPDGARKTGATQLNAVNATGTTAERALLVTVVIGPPRKALTCGAAQARNAAGITDSRASGSS